MDFIKQSWAQIGATLETMSFATKGFIVACIIIGLGAFAFMVYVVGQPERVTIASGGNLSAAKVVLEAHGIDAEIAQGELKVALDDQHMAIAKLADNDRIGGDAVNDFAKLVKADPWETNAQMRSKYTVAMQSYLSKVVSRMKGVRSASVMLALPEHKGFGRTTAKPSASVMLDMSRGEGVPKDMVKAIASLVSGAVAEMTPQDVEVIGSNGRSYSVDDPEEELPTKALELVRSEEKYHQQKITDFLMIRGSVISVSVDLDATIKEEIAESGFQETGAIRSEKSTESMTKDMDKGGEAGVRSNNALDIAGTGNVSRESSDADSSSEFYEPQLTRRSLKQIAGHQVQQINVTINIPRKYFVSIFRAGNPDAEAPTEDQLQPVITAELARITEKVEPLISRGDKKGVVKASMYFDDQYLEPVAAGAGGGITDAMGSWAGKGGSVVLAVAALGLVFYIVTRTTKEEDLPTVEELAGIPQTLPADDELLGEAEEVESTMAGVELDEGQLQARKVAEQISEMIKSSPQEAGGLLGKWVAVDD